MVDKKDYPSTEIFSDPDLVNTVEFGETYLLVESIDGVLSEDFRQFLSEEIVELDDNYGLEVRAKEDSEGFVGIVSDEVEHPVQKATIYCGFLELDDRQTYQVLVKTTELVNAGLFDSEDESAFAASVIQILSTSFKPEPYDSSYLCKAFKLDAKKLNEYTVRIVDHVS